MLAASKTCFKCSRQLPLGEFYAHPMMADGHLNKCKECAKRDARENRSKRLDYYRAYDRDRGSRIGNEGMRRYRAANPEKARAHASVNYAVREGHLQKAPCMICGRPDSHGHHDNYERPLDVVWLCPVHHFERHKTL